MAAFNQNQTQYYTVPTFGTKSTPTTSWFTPSTTPGSVVSTTFGNKLNTSLNWLIPQTNTSLVPETKPNPSPFTFGLKPATSTFGFSNPTFTTKPVNTSTSTWLTPSTKPVTTTTSTWLTPSAISSSTWSKPFGLNTSSTSVSTTTSSFSPSKAPSFFKTSVSVDSPSNACCVPFSFQAKPEKEQTTLYNSASNINLVDLNLPKNKIEGLISMVCLDQKHTLSNIKLMLDNVFDINAKFSVENLWFISLIKYSDEKFLLNKVNEQHIPFAVLYASLLRELMVENIQTPEQMYEWLIDFAKKHKNRKMLWLFTILKNTGSTKFEDILDLNNGLEVFVSALQTFIEYDNNPMKTVENALQSTNILYKTFLLSMVGASYGTNFGLITESNSDLDSLVSSFK